MREINIEDSIALKETTRISLREYSPNWKVPLDKNEIFMAQVQKEDEHRHAYDPIPEIPKHTKIAKIKRDVPGWVNFYKDILLSNLKQLMP